MKHTIRTLLLIFALLPSALYGQGTEAIVQGTVTSKQTGETLIAVSVTEVDATNRIVTQQVTDFNGQFVIKVKNTKNKLSFNYLGYVSTSRPIEGARTINVAMVESTQQLTDVVVKAEKRHSDGTFSIPQREVSTAVQKISTKEFEGIQVTSIDDALQGRIAGLDIVANSGDPGAGTSMRIRGTSSINASSEPLIVVNGVPYEVPVDPTFDFANANTEQFATMLSINPDDIAEITVLKDAASTAVWGSKGANGVLMITTKRGVQGPTRITYTYRLTQARQPKGLEMLNGDDYTMMMRQAFFNPVQNENAGNYRAFLYAQSYSEYENFNNNTDWIDAVTQVGFTHDHNITASGGGDKAQFRISAGLLDQKGTVIGQEMNRFSFRSNLDYTINDRIKIISEFSYTYTDNDRNYQDTEGDRKKETILGIAYRKMPNVSIYTQNLDGSSTDEYYNIPVETDLNGDQLALRNPVALANMGVNNVKNFRILPTLRLVYDILDPAYQNLKFQTYVSFDIDNTKVSKYLPNGVSNAGWTDFYSGLAESEDKEYVTIMNDNNLTWSPRLVNRDHDLQLYGSMQFRSGRMNVQGIRTRQLPSGEITDASAQGYIDYPFNSPFYYRSMGMLFRGHYAYKGKYIFDLTVRRDGSTKFAKDQKFGNFPGISAKWIISDESWMQSLKPLLSTFAIRPSWGITGNEPPYEGLQYSRYVSYGEYLGEPAMRPSTPQVDIRWEKSTSLNLGMDLGLWDDRLIFDFNYYHKRTEDLLMKDIQMPSSSGMTLYAWKNVGVMDNDGWELNFQTADLIKINKFKMDFNFNLSNYVNTIVDFDDDVLESFQGEFTYVNGEYLSRIQEGNSYGSIYGFRYKGVYQYNDYIPGVQENAPVARDENGNVFTTEDGEPLPMYFAYGRSNPYEFKGGDAIYEDINHDGNINELDIVYLGNSNPKVNGGFGTSIRFKNFSCNAFFNFRYGNKVVNIARMKAENMHTMDNQSTSVNWRWRKDGDVTDMPRALYQYGYNWLGSDRYVEDGSFVRFKNLTFGYGVGAAKLKKYNINSVALTLSINNIFVLSKYTGVDPEVGYGALGVSKDEARTPRAKDFTLGITVGF